MCHVASREFSIRNVQLYLHLPLPHSFRMSEVSFAHVCGILCADEPETFRTNRVRVLFGLEFSSEQGRRTASV